MQTFQVAIRQRKEKIENNPSCLVYLPFLKVIGCICFQLIHQEKLILPLILLNCLLWKNIIFLENCKLHFCNYVSYLRRIFVSVFVQRFSHNLKCVADSLRTQGQISKKWFEKIVLEIKHANFQLYRVYPARVI